MSTRLGVGASTGADEELAELEAHAPAADALRRLLRVEHRDGRVDLALRRETRLERKRDEALRAARGHRLLREPIGVGETSFVECLLRLSSGDDAACARRSPASGTTRGRRRWTRFIE